MKESQNRIHWLAKHKITTALLSYKMHVCYEESYD